MEEGISDKYVEVCYGDGSWQSQTKEGLEDHKSVLQFIHIFLILLSQYRLFHLLNKGNQALFII